MECRRHRLVERHEDETTSAGNSAEALSEDEGLLKRKRFALSSAMIGEDLLPGR